MINNLISKNANFMLTIALRGVASKDIARAAIDMNPKIRTTGKHNNKVTKNEIQ